MAPIQGGIIHIIIWSRGVSTTQRKGGFGCVRDPGDPREELATVTSKIWPDKEGKKGNQPAGLREGLEPQLGGRKSWERGTQAGGSESRVWEAEEVEDIGLRVEHHGQQEGQVL